MTAVEALIGFAVRAHACELEAARRVRRDRVQAFLRRAEAYRRLCRGLAEEIVMAEAQIRRLLRDGH